MHGNKTSKNLDKTHLSHRLQGQARIEPIPHLDDSRTRDGRINTSINLHTEIKQLEQRLVRSDIRLFKASSRFGRCWIFRYDLVDYRLAADGILVGGTDIGSFFGEEADGGGADAVGSA